MDADALIERNRALVALAEQTRRGSREAVAIARTMRGAAKAVRDKAAHRIDTDVTWRLPATRTKSFVVSPAMSKACRPKRRKSAPASRRWSRRRSGRLRPRRPTEPDAAALGH
jgi:hypothetical protein